MPAIPERWADYKPIGKQIEGTRFIAFKVPLRKDLLYNVQQEIRFDTRILLKRIPNLGLIIDLTNTNRYYDPNDFQAKGIIHKKLMIEGQKTPRKNLVDKFTMMVKNFLDSNKDNDKLIGVHCTHGVNRTGYMICYYMISQMAMEPNEAFSKFFNARGHRIERNNYIDSLKNIRESTNQNSNNNQEARPKNWQRSKTDVVPLQNWRQQRRISPTPTPRCSRQNSHDAYSYRTRTDQINQKDRPTAMPRTNVIQSENWRQREQDQKKSNDKQFRKKPLSSCEISQRKNKFRKANVRSISPSPTPRCSRQSRRNTFSYDNLTDRKYQHTVGPSTDVVQSENWRQRKQYQNKSNDKQFRKRPLSSYEISKRKNKFRKAN